MNDLPLKTKNAILDFADDTTISKSGSSDKEVTDDMNEEMEKAVSLFDNNDILVNIGKTKAMLVSCAKNNPLSKTVLQKLK